MVRERERDEDDDKEMMNDDQYEVQCSAQQTELDSRPSRLGQIENIWDVLNNSDDSNP